MDDFRQQKQQCEAKNAETNQSNKQEHIYGAMNRKMLLSYVEISTAYTNRSAHPESGRKKQMFEQTNKIQTNRERNPRAPTSCKRKPCMTNATRRLGQTSNNYTNEQTPNQQTNKRI